MTTTVTIKHAEHRGPEPRREKVRVEQVDTMAGGHRILVAELTEGESTVLHVYGEQTLVVTEVLPDSAGA